MKNQIHKRKRCSIVVLCLKYSMMGQNHSHFEHNSFLFGNCVPQNQEKMPQIRGLVIVIFCRFEIRKYWVEV
jgi:hypothetical protein